MGAKARLEEEQWGEWEGPERQGDGEEEGLGGWGERVLEGPEDT